MRGDGGVASEGRVVGVPKFHSRSKCTVILTNINSDLMSKACSGLGIKVKWGNLERKFDFDTCCSGKICSKSKTMFVWEAHLSTVKAGKSCLTLLLYLGCTADQSLRVHKLVGGVTWNAFCLDM